MTGRGAHGNGPSHGLAIGDGPPPEDMWQDWSDELRSVAPEVGALPVRGPKL